MSEREVVAFASKESDFIYNFGVNRGHSLSYSKVNRCYFLSSNAKQLYHNICDYAYGGRRNCFPSQAKLQAELGWTRPTIRQYTKELVDSGFITITHRVGQTMLYTIVELHMVPMLVHSELIHQIRVSCDDSDEFYSALEIYRKSELYEIVSKSPNPLEYVEAINLWFRQMISCPSDSGVGLEAETLEVDNVPPPIDNPPTRVVKVIDTSGIQQEPITTGRKRAKKSERNDIDPNSVPIEEWDIKTFIRYFELEYYDKYRRAVMAITKPEQGAFSGLYSKYKEDKDVLKAKMDVYFSNSFFDTYPRSMANFCSKFVQAKLDEYRKTGKITTPGNRVTINPDDAGGNMETIFD